MENFIILFAIAGFAVFMILRFDKSQKKRVSKVLFHTEKVEPLFMKQAAEQKMFTLRSALREFETVVTTAHVSPGGEESYQKIQSKLQEIIGSYSTGEMPLSAYCSKLDSLINTVQRLKKDLVSSAA
ncbi:hypothetical protein DJ568_14800 [Mucilaginibacter hurinus]|uniref:Uncharacterized protein n=1 Tax=Mucilaginibacter hurinus TaxID=2201324 RepID=A0A367GM83_9SPHI|nr:hypothetical protein [Mucilaginibacter hurinus]RCH54145.1 hypothetical protein DJ568_14800 [Mucilaginibacter hurinus]